MLILIFWGYCGYLLLLLFVTTLDHEVTRIKPETEEFLKTAVIIPCYNEEGYIKEKIDNLKKLEYEQDKVEFFFLNGLSTDNTSKHIAKYIKGMPNYHLIETGVKGKISQINYGLAHVVQGFDLIVNTDMDAILAPDVLIKIVDEFNSNDLIGVVGVNISPHSILPFENQFWANQNIMRILESHVYISSIVVAPCYAYKASLIDRFPKDCIADDIYISFEANTEGYLTKYLHDATGIEIRSSNSSEEFFRHKYRKGNAYLIEIMRFFYRLPNMTRWWKMMFLTKLLQLAVLPWILPYFLLSTLSLILSGGAFAQFAIFGIIFLMSFMTLTSYTMKIASRKFQGKEDFEHRSALLLFILSNIILIIVGLTFPFYKQTSSYEKVDKTR